MGAGRSFLRLALPNVTKGSMGTEEAESVADRTHALRLALACQTMLCFVVNHNAQHVDGACDGSRHIPPSLISDDVGSWASHEFIVGSL